MAGWGSLPLRLRPQGPAGTPPAQPWPTGDSRPGARQQKATVHAQLGFPLGSMGVRSWGAGSPQPWVQGNRGGQTGREGPWLPSGLMAPGEGGSLSPQASQLPAVASPPPPPQAVIVLPAVCAWPPPGHASGFTPARAPPCPAGPRSRPPGAPDLEPSHPHPTGRAAHAQHATGPGCRDQQPLSQGWPPGEALQGPPLPSLTSPVSCVYPAGRVGSTVGATGGRAPSGF